MLAKLTSFKVIERSKDKLPVIFLGSIEQHGVFMPVGTDFILAERLSEALEKKLGSKIIIFPPLPYGCAKEHRDFPGTISINYSTFMLLIKEILESLQKAGFRGALLVSTHGGNNLIGQVIQADWNFDSDFKVEFMYIFDESVNKKTVELFGGEELHAGSSENSLIAALEPNSVVYLGKRINRNFKPSKMGRVFSVFNAKEVTKLGILNWSDKLEVDPKKGEELFNFILDNLCLKVRAILPQI